MRALCPNNVDHKRFLVTAHVTQGWEVNEHGDFIKVTSECDEVTHKPDSQDIWTCSECGAEASVTD